MSQELRFRQIHLDFHTSPDLPGIGSDFDPEEFASTLEKARVDSITCFARCHHGMIYYDSKVNPERVHPYLVNKNLLKNQIEACHRHGIRVPVYTSVQWDHYTAIRHPEWMVVTEEGAFENAKPYEPGFYGRLCVNSPYRDFLKAHVKEILETLPVDGLFFDIVCVTDCSCRYCRAGMEAKGLDLTQKEVRIAYAQQMMNDFKMEMTSFVRQYKKDGTIFYNRGHVGTAEKLVKDAYTHFELESLPSGGWGYLHFPLSVRYVRNFGKDYLAHTGKFHTSWGDCHSFKNIEALEFECFNMLAFNAKCLIGDQLEPGGRLSPPVYDLIGSVYSRVEKKEPWCRGAKAITDIGVFTSEEFYGDKIRVRPEIAGALSMLQEAGHQFEIIDSACDFSRFKVLILPDTIPVSQEFAAKLEQYLNKGGKLIASFESGLNKEKTQFNLKALGVKLQDGCTTTPDGQPVRGQIFPRNDYADYILPQGMIGKGLPETEHVMYIKGTEIVAEPGTEVLANVILPYFNRTYQHFSSHRQTPSSGQVGYPGIVKNGNTIYFSHPIFTQYRENAPKWYKVLFLNALNMLLPDPVLIHKGPSTMITTLNEQTKENRYILHLLHYIPQRRSKKIDTIEDIIPLYNIEVSVRVPKKVTNVKLVPEGKKLEYNFTGERVEFIVPEITGHQMIAIQLESEH